MAKKNKKKRGRISRAFLSGLGTLLPTILTILILVIAYNFIKKFFEYANGYQPSLKQRLDLFAMIPDEPDECRMKDLITKTLVYSLSGEQE